MLSPVPDQECLCATVSALLDTQLHFNCPFGTSWRLADKRHTWEEIAGWWAQYFLSPRLRLLTHQRASPLFLVRYYVITMLGYTETFCNHPCRHLHQPQDLKHFLPLPSCDWSVTAQLAVSGSQPSVDGHGCLHSAGICLAVVRSLASKGNKISASWVAWCEVDYDS